MLVEMISETREEYCAKVSCEDMRRVDVNRCMQEKRVREESVREE